MSIKNIILHFFILFLLSTCCKKAKKDPIRRKGIIEKVKNYHYGYGIFDLEVYCKFKYMGNNYNGLYIGKFDGGYGTEFKEKDSVLVTFYELEKERINEIIKIEFLNNKLPLQK